MGLTNFILKGVDVYDGDAFVIHPHSSHGWKNEDHIIMTMEYRRPVRLVGKLGEVICRPDWEDLTRCPFDVMVAAVLQARCVVSVHSSFMNLAGLFGKRQILVSHSEDMPNTNPRMLRMFHPSKEELQAAIHEAAI